MKSWAASVLWIVACAGASSVQAQDRCAFQGELLTPYCDGNRDWVADPPTDPKRWIDPSPLVFSYSPSEDPTYYEKLFRPFTEALSICLARPVVYQPYTSSVEELDAFRTGRLHLAVFSTGATVYAARTAGAVPFAVKGYADHYQGTQLWVLVRKDSPYKVLADLKGRTVAHVTESSMSGNLAPLALFPKEKVVPGKDYQVVFTGKHDTSIMGVASGQYEAATIASNVFERLAVRKEIRASDFRVIYRSAKYPSSTLAYPYNLEPKLKNRLLKCVFEYRYDDTMQKAFDGADRFYPITYARDYALVRDVADQAGELMHPSRESLPRVSVTGR